MSHNTVGILLAAGKSTRFGSNKLLHLLPDTQQAVAVQSARNLLEALPNSIAVVRPEDNELKSLLSATGIRVIDNPDAELGMSSSIRCGIEAVINKNPEYNDTFNGWILALADMPHIPPEIIVNIVKQLTDDTLICAPQYNGRRGHPVGFSHQLTSELLTLEGDKGARTVVEKYTSQVKLIDSPSEGVLLDIDYLEDV